MTKKGYKQTEEHKLKCSKNLTHHYEKGHKFIAGGEKGWFKKGDLHCKYWLGKKKDNSYLKEYQFKKGEHANPATEFKKGIHYSPATEINKESRKLMVRPMHDTKIEVKLQKYLKQLGVEFYTHQYIKDIEHGYQCDILIPSKNCIIEAYGNYWHSYPLAREIDIIRCKELRENGYKVLIFWESEIRPMRIEEFKNKLIQCKIL